jgi:electron transfer flavoprotein alpha subunit
MSKLNNVWVLAEKQQTVNELCAGAAQFGENVSVIWIGSKELACAANTIYHLGEVNNSRLFIDYLTTIIQLIQTHKPELLLVDTSRNGRLAAGAVATACKTSVMTDVNSIEVSDGAIQTKRMVYGGAAFKTEKVQNGMGVVCVPVGVFEANGVGTPALVDVEYVAPAVTVECIEKRQKVGEVVDLRSAKRVVGVGRGFPNAESVQIAHDFAAVVGAEVGCSRPIAEEEKWMSKERYLGISGTMIKPEIYFGVGISGQVQHMVGVNQARVIVAINKDKNAPIFKQADYGIIGDLKVILPELTALIKK